MKQIAIGAVALFSFVGACLAGEGKVRRMPEPIVNEYLVMLQGIRGHEVPGAAASLMNRFGGRTIVQYQNASTGFAARMTDAQATALSHDPTV